MRSLLRRHRFRLALVYVAGALTPFALSLIGTHVVDPWVYSTFRRTEIVRTTSPDGVVDAVLVEVNPGAFSSYVYNLYVVPRGAKPEGRTLLSGSRLGGFRLDWKEAHLLDLQYMAGSVYDYGSIWSSPKVRDGEYYVELRLTPLTDGFLVLKPGGGFR